MSRSLQLLKEPATNNNVNGNPFPKLFSPIKVGPLTLRNRLVSSANYTALSENNLPSERFAYYHAEKAKGGLAMTLTGELPVSPACRYSLPRSIRAYDPACIPGFKVMTEMVHRYGALAAAQLQHSGARQYGFDPTGMSVKLTMAPSNLPTTVDEDGYSVPMSMDSSQIEMELQYYKQTATNLIEAGFDGLEIKSDSSSLPAQFLSPLTNKRSDEYGGSLENRMRFLDQVISLVHEATGGKKIIGIKIPGDEFNQKGLSHADIRAVARHIDRENSVNYIMVGGGNLGFDPDLNTPSAYYPQGLFVSLAEGIRKEVSERVKVITLGRIVDPSFAEEVISSGKADLVSMMRAIIADPELPRKASQGRVSEIIPCIACNQGCLLHVLSNRPTTCILNPATGREKEWGIGTIRRASEKKRVVVVGAGPAGIECARIARERGHEVFLYEKSGSIGGQTLLASNLPGRKELSRAISFWKGEIERLGIKLYLNHKFTPEEVDSIEPDVVVCATGIKAEEDNSVRSPAFPPPKGVQFLKPLSNIAKDGKNSGDALIYDDRGDFQALGWTELLADSGSRRVTLVTRHPMVGLFVEPWTRLTAFKRLAPKGVKFVVDSYLKEVRADSAVYVNSFSKEETSIPSQETYFVSWPLPENTLYNELVELSKSKNIKLFSIGDCAAPRSIEEAVFEGHDLGRKL